MHVVSASYDVTPVVSSIPPYRTARIRSESPKKTGRSLRGLPLIAFVVIGVLLLSSLTLATARPSLSERTLSGGSVAPDATVIRDPLLWPFAKNSIWNLPIGASANYVWANIRHATQMAY